MEACVEDCPSVFVFFLFFFGWIPEGSLGVDGRSGMMVDRVGDVVRFVTRDVGISFVEGIRSSSAITNPTGRRIEHKTSSMSKENGFTYRTTRGNRPRYRDLCRLSVHLLTQSTFPQDSNLPKATERSRTRPLRSICMVHTSVSLIPDSVVVDGRARSEC